MSHGVQTLQSDKYQSAAAVLARAFRDDPVIVAILKEYGPEERVRLLTSVYHKELLTCGPANTPLEASANQIMTGAALIHRPGKYPPPLLTQLSIFWTGFTAVKSLPVMGRWLKLLALLEKKHPKEPHFYLELIGTDTPCQGRGVGSQLLSHLVGWADDSKVGCYLETSNPRNLPLYTRFGFNITAEEPILGVTIWMMWRPAALQTPFP